MTMADDSPQARKSQQINIRLTEAQALVLKKYCTAHDLTTNTVVLAALSALVKGFDEA